MIPLQSMGSLNWYRFMADVFQEYIHSNHILHHQLVPYRLVTNGLVKNMLKCEATVEEAREVTVCSLSWLISCVLIGMFSIQVQDASQLSCYLVMPHDTTFIVH